MNRHFLVWLSLMMIPISTTAEEAVDPFELSLQEIMSYEVISVSKRAQSQFTVPAAIHVISNKDIVRSGATSIGEVLRGVPGLQVARINANSWAISGRGFNGHFANKLLVLVDGRAVYTPMFAGVYWANQEFILADIERIEIIRGPGAAMWGANAVNGVINIITRHSRDTQGISVYSSVGASQEIAGIRFGGTLSDDTTYRAHAKYAKREDFNEPLIAGLDPGTDNINVGFRIDSAISESDTIYFSADYLVSDHSSILGAIDPMTGTKFFLPDERTFIKAHAQIDWTHTVNERNEHKLQFYYDLMEDDTLFPLASRFDTYDFTYQHTWAWSANQTAIWGLGYRHVNYETTGTVGFNLSDPEDTDNNWSIFIHNESVLMKDQVALSYGARYEDNERGGATWQPNARISWQLSERFVAWASLARAVRTPSIAEEDVVTIGLSVPEGIVPPMPVPILASLDGSGDLDPEILDAFDIGLRMHLSEQITIDLAVFNYQYKDIILASLDDVICADGRSLHVDPDCISTSPFIIIQNSTTNSGQASSSGIEVSINWRPAEQLSFEFHYSYLDLQIAGSDTVSDFYSALIQGPNAEHQLTLNWRYEPKDDWTFDGQIRQISSLRNPDIESYAVFDVRLSWQARPNLRFALVGQDLGDAKHLEFIENFSQAPAVEIDSTLLLQFELLF